LLGVLVEEVGLSWWLFESIFSPRAAQFRSYSQLSNNQSFNLQISFTLKPKEAGKFFDLQRRR
jgi:hypothetical protein